ncbi:MAG TPA: DNA-3-methyladenine glycosylase [Pyrinomonadaceae bacterium]|jgi:DNA-3-methyladenine glycosylase|nr:DNA-3-methyladenine glycosylase [Pyrinomonadaceae bacterium]
MARPAKLPREFYTRVDTLLIARQLLGQRLVVPTPEGARVAGRIVETEAYMAPEDRASHAFGNRRTPRTEPMFGRGGTAYVYFIYGMYYQFNVVTGLAGVPHAVLVRAVEPLEGTQIMRARRPVKDERRLTDGPGKLCLAMGIDRSFNRADLRGDLVWIEEGEREVAAREIASGPRVGIDYAGEFVSKPWRFWLKDNPYVSRKR